ncbi:ABC transporter permease [Rathayibacter toxicus]|uniref:ABC transporter permease n=1 Tax=Rathayibacter toxicus TaxID=145458 RepID=A0A0C5BDI3_9MICO|nr:ABC transporter permease [Rathayibacter toxicus]AJM77004.1 hypothetical protein TI83_01530 [Rathayibacter toxicus]ALS57197.1 hypothetical protein APU90_04960 [Rathayibacter toxicus]KKM46001.1 hypothetical protein VT73_02545 [Rathayibacter toxicus]PPG22929.1 ABC transporter permease [Rathayibacter toxicus]PPG47510.1 ABC transporter permease [Rathayibacter toxicus]
MNRVREFSPTILVAALSTVYGSVLVIAPGVVSDAIAMTDFRESQTARDILNVAAVLFIAVALYVGAIVTANTCTTIITGQTRVIALQRLLGATGASLRARVTRVGLTVGLFGAVIGALIGVALSLAAVTIFRGTGLLPDTSYTVLPPTLLLPIIAVPVTTWAAFAVGSSRVLSVTPLEALSSTVEPSHGDLRASTGRRVGAIVLLGIGGALIGLGLLLSLTTPLAAVVAALGAFISFAGVAIGSVFIVPPMLHILSRIGRRDPVVLLAGRNALRAPARVSRATIGLVIGITLLITVAVALGTMQQYLEGVFFSPRFAEAQTSGSFSAESEVQMMRDLFLQINSVVSVLIGFTAIVAGTGVVNALALGVLQRRREFGLLRALGLTGSQVRRMIVTEAVQMVVAAVLAGVALGSFYGWLGAQTLFGGASHKFLVPVIPPLTIAIIIFGTIILTAVATIAPVRTVLRVAPTEALSVS